jgi:hypothetical protein
MKGTRRAISPEMKATSGVEGQTRQQGKAARINRAIDRCGLGPPDAVSGLTGLGRSAGGAGSGFYSTSVGAGFDSLSSPRPGRSYSVAIGGGDGAVFSPRRHNDFGLPDAVMA